MRALSNSRLIYFLRALPKSVNHDVWKLHRAKKRMAVLTFINCNNDAPDRRYNLSLINAHCSAVSHRNRRIHAKTRAKVWKVGFVKQTAGKNKSHVAPERSLLIPEDSAKHRAHFQELEHVGHHYIACTLKQSRLDVQSATHFGSPATDFFSRLPIKNHGQVQTAYEFFVHAYAPLITKSFASQPNGESLSSGFKTYMQVLLQDEMVFEQMMACSLTIQSADEDFRIHMVPQILYHSNRSVRHLRERLQSDSEGSSPAVLMTIITLATTYIWCGEHDSVDAHVRALQHIVALRGGYSNLGWGGLIESRAKQ